MHARVVAFEGGELERVREIGEASGDSQAMTLPGGVTSALVLADQERHRRLFITLFDSREALDSAEAWFDNMGAQSPEEVRGRRTSVEVYEVVLAKDLGNAKAARVSSLEVPPAHIDDGIRYAQDVLLPKVRELPGWRGALALIDRETGAARFMTFWESADVMHASEEGASQLREASAPDAPEAMSGLEGYDVVFSQRS